MDLLDEINHFIQHKGVRSGSELKWQNSKGCEITFQQVSGRENYVGKVNGREKKLDRPYQAATITVGPAPSIPHSLDLQFWLKKIADEDIRVLNDSMSLAALIQYLDNYPDSAIYGY